MARYNIGDLVMFTCRTQICESGMRISKVHEAPILGDGYTRYEIDAGPSGSTWGEGAFVPYEEWKSRLDENTN